jgi:hypothetical protein
MDTSAALILLIELTREAQGGVIFKREGQIACLVNKQLCLLVSNHPIHIERSFIFDLTSINEMT